jgi:hypothetical protein
MTPKKNKQKRDWLKYNDNLVNRSKLTLFITKDFADTFHVNYNKDSLQTRGSQAKYTETAIT